MGYNVISATDGGTDTTTGYTPFIRLEFDGPVTAGDFSAGDFYISGIAVAETVTQDGTSALKYTAASWTGSNSGDMGGQTWILTIPDNGSGPVGDVQQVTPSQGGATDSNGHTIYCDAGGHDYGAVNEDGTHFKVTIDSGGTPGELVHDVDYATGNYTYLYTNVGDDADVQRMCDAVAADSGWYFQPNGGDTTGDVGSGIEFTTANATLFQYVPDYVTPGQTGTVSSYVAPENASLTFKSFDGSDFSQNNPANWTDNPTVDRIAGRLPQSGDSWTYTDYPNDSLSALGGIAIGSFSVTGSGHVQGQQTDNYAAFDGGGSVSVDPPTPYNSYAFNGDSTGSPLYVASGFTATGDMANYAQYTVFAGDVDNYSPGGSDWPGCTCQNLIVEGSASCSNWTILGNGSAGSYNPSGEQPGRINGGTIAGYAIESLAGIIYNADGSGNISATARLGTQITNDFGSGLSATFYDTQASKVKHGQSVVFPMF